VIRPLQGKFAESEAAPLGVFRRHIPERPSLSAHRTAKPEEKEAMVEVSGEKEETVEVSGES